MKHNEEVAKFFRSMKPKERFEACIGIVIKTLPELTISIKDSSIILYPRMLYMNDRLFDDYTRQYSLDGEITEYDFDNTTKSDPVPNHPSHPIPKLKGNGVYKAKGTIINTCTLEEGDLVKVTPAQNGMWFVDYKVRKI